MTTKSTALLCILATLLLSGCATVTSSPPGARCYFTSLNRRNNSFYVRAGDFWFSRTPAYQMSADYLFCAVKWDDGTSSEWRRFNENQHFTKGKRQLPRDGDSELKDLNYSLNPNKKKWGVSFKDNTGDGSAPSFLTITRLCVPSDKHRQIENVSTSLSKPKKLQTLNYTFDSESNLGSITVKVGEEGLDQTRTKVIAELIAKICSSKNIAHVAGEENLETGGYYRTLNEHLQDDILTIHFQAVK